MNDKKQPSREKPPRAIRSLYGEREARLKAETNGAFVMGDYTCLSVGLIKAVRKGQAPAKDTIMVSVDAHDRKGRLHLRPVFMQPKEARRIAYALLALANDLDPE